MSPISDNRWRSRLEIVDFAFQPIVNIHSGACFGYEALLRNHEKAGFTSISDLFDRAYQEGVLHQTDLFLRDKAVSKFRRLSGNEGIKLFYNIDNRVLDSQDYEQGNTARILESHGMPPENICFELTESHGFADPLKIRHVIDGYRSRNFKIAMDDYGIGVSGLQMLYFSEPDFIKIDRFFIHDIENDAKKQIFAASIVNIAHLLGSLVVAEGVETESEFTVCREIGCDLLQGHLIACPDINLECCKPRFECISRLCSRDRRKNDTKDRFLIDMEMEFIEPVRSNADLFEVFENFRKKNSFGFFPVVNQSGEPLGVIREKSLKGYAYSRFGTELLQNPAYGKNLKRFIHRFPIADIHTPVETILEIYSQNEDIEGIIIVDRMKYAGFLSAHSLLRVLNEKNLTAARDQNPLSRLPGNTKIFEFISRALNQLETHYALVYFDFDNFKPYNDKYGFRHGDRVILLFADILREHADKNGRFVGHIGGDDFFMGAPQKPLDGFPEEVAAITEKFRRDVTSFYDAEALENGYIDSTDREGRIKRFPLMTVSAVILELPAGRKRIFDTETVGNRIARLKKKAKSGDRKVVIHVLNEGAEKGKTPGGGRMEGRPPEFPTGFDVQPVSSDGGR